MKSSRKASSSRQVKPSLTRGIVVFGFEGINLLLGFALGMLVVRALSVSEYAVFTAYSAAIGAGFALIDSGFRTALLREISSASSPSSSAYVFQGSSKIKSSLLLRASIVAMLLFFLLRYTGAKNLWIDILIPLVLLGGLLASHMAFEQAGTWLISQRRANLYQGAKIGRSVARLVMLGGGILYGAHDVSCTGVLAALLIVDATSAILMRRDGPRNDVYLDNAEQRSEAQRAVGAIQQNITSLFPSTAYFAVSSQIPVWYASVVLMPSDMATLGAVSRYTVVFSVMSSALAITHMPTFAHSIHESSTPVTALLRSLCTFALIHIVAVGVLLLLSPILLAALGPSYENSFSIFWAVVVASAIASLGASASQLFILTNVVLASSKLIPLSITIKVAYLFLAINQHSLLMIVFIGIIDPLLFNLIRYLELRRRRL